MSAGWVRRDRCENGPADAEHTVLLLPGGMCTAVQYEELMAQPALAGIHLVAVTMPGHGGTAAPEDLSDVHPHSRPARPRAGVPAFHRDAENHGCRVERDPAAPRPLPPPAATCSSRRARRGAAQERPARRSHSLLSAVPGPPRLGRVTAVPGRRAQGAYQANITAAEHAAPPAIRRACVRVLR